MELQTLFKRESSEDPFFIRIKNPRKMGSGSAGTFSEPPVSKTSLRFVSCTVHKKSSSSVAVKRNVIYFFYHKNDIVYNLQSMHLDH